MNYVESKKTFGLWKFWYKFYYVAIAGKNIIHTRKTKDRLNWMVANINDLNNNLFISIILHD